MKRTLISAALAMSIAMAFTPAKADLSDAARSLLPETTVLDFSFYNDYKINYTSGNWKEYWTGGDTCCNSRHIGYGWSTWFFAGLTRPDDLVSSEDYSGTLEVTRDNGNFYFDSATLFTFSMGGAAPYEITGWLNGAQVFSTSGPVGRSFDESIANPYATTAIDKLQFKLTSLGTPDCLPSSFSCAKAGDYVGVSNIFVTRAAVPEPGSVALMVTGLAVMGALVTRRKKTAQLLSVG